MDTVKQLKLMQEFAETYHKPQLLENIRTGKKSIILDFKEISKFDPDLASDFLDDPAETLKAAEIGIRELLDNGSPAIYIRLRNLPESTKIKIVDSRAQHLNKFVTIIAEVARKSKVYVDRVSAKFECPGCANIINILQLKETFQEPDNCSCGRKGRFILLDKEMTDIQELTIIDSVDNQEEGDMYQELTVLLKEDLTSPEINKTVLVPNNTVMLTGYFEELEIISRTGKKMRRLDKVFIANCIESAEDQRKEFYPTKDEIEEFKKLTAESNFWGKLIKGFAPTIYGHDLIKEAMLLQLVGGVRRKKHGDKYRRGDIHLGLVGDPGMAKTDLILRTADLLPRSRFVGGKGASAVGIGQQINSRHR